MAIVFSFIIHTENTNSWVLELVDENHENWYRRKITVKTRVKYATAYSTRIQKAVQKVGKKPSSYVLYAGKKWENDSFQKRNFAS